MGNLEWGTPSAALQGGSRTSALQGLPVPRVGYCRPAESPGVRHSKCRLTGRKSHFRTPSLFPSPEWGIAGQLNLLECGTPSAALQGGSRTSALQGSSRPPSYCRPAESPGVRHSKCRLTGRKSHFRTPSLFPSPEWGIAGQLNLLECGTPSAALQGGSRTSALQVFSRPPSGVLQAG